MVEAPGCRGRSRSHFQNVHGAAGPAQSHDAGKMTENSFCETDHVCQKWWGKPYELDPKTQFSKLELQIITMNFLQVIVNLSQLQAGQLFSLYYKLQKNSREVRYLTAINELMINE